MSQSPRVPEKSVQAQIVHLLRSIGASVYVLGTVRPKGDTPGTRQTPGIPDLYAFLPSRGYAPDVTLWVEVKAQGGRLRPAQIAFRESCSRANQPHVVGGLEDVVSYLRCGGWVRAA